MTNEIESIKRCLFDKEQIDKTKDIFNMNLNGINFGMTEFQIDNFVLNKKEFPTDFFRFKQAKFELYNRLQVVTDLYYQYKKIECQIELHEGIIEKIFNEEKYIKIKDAKIKLQKLEIERNKLMLISIKKQAVDKLNEANIFFKTYSKLERFDSMTKKDIDLLESEGWKTKSLYYPELYNRYGLTLDGFEPLQQISQLHSKIIDECKQSNLL